jgi:transcriptional regulator with PAS, ATPase and Fis domain
MTKTERLQQLKETETFSIQDMRKRNTLRALNKFGDQKSAAAALGIDRKTLHNWKNNLGIWYDAGSGLWVAEETLTIKNQ